MISVTKKNISLTTVYASQHLFESKVYSLTAVSTLNMSIHIRGFLFFRENFRFVFKIKINYALDDI